MNIKKKAIIAGLLTILPPGIPLLYLLLDLLNFCTGSAFNSGINCYVPFGSYIANVAETFEASWFVVIPGLLWLIASISIWVYTFLYLSFVLLGKGNESKLSVNKITVLGSRYDQPQSLFSKIFQAIILLIVIIVTVAAIALAADYFGLV